MKTYLSLVAAAVVFSAAAIATAGPADVRDMKVSAAHENSEIYRHEINLLDRELQHLDQDLQWLENKISTIMLMNRPVSRALRQSVVYKKNHRALLVHSRNQYREMLADVIAGLPDSDSTAQKPAVSREPENDPGVLQQDTDPALVLSARGSQAAHALLARMQVYNMADWFDIVPARRHAAALVTTLPIQFSSGSAVVSKEYKGFFQKISAFVKDWPMHIIVDGFADPDPISTRKYPSNFELGAARATNVIHALTNCGVDPALFKAATTGKYRFPDDRPMSEEKSMERYVRITLLPGSS